MPERSGEGVFGRKKWAKKKRIKKRGGLGCSAFYF